MSKLIDSMKFFENNVEIRKKKGLKFYKMNILISVDSLVEIKIY